MRRGSGESGERPKWRFESESTEPPPPLFLPEEGYLDRVWQELQILHAAFRGVDQAEYSTLVRRLQEIDLLFLKSEDLDDYYRECHLPEASVREMIRTDEPPLPHRTRSTDKVAALQIQFMEDVFYTLQLDRYGNSPENRGWMNLFRRWGRSPTLNERFDELRSTFSEHFGAFYQLYIRDQSGTIEEVPLPHPWDRRKPRQGPGIFLDSGIREVEARPRGGGERPVPEPGSGAHGIVDAKGGAQTYEQPAKQGDSDDGGPSSAGQTNQ
jgi:hypothetical protein